MNTSSPSDAQKAPATIPSPCMGVCQIDRDTKFCLGCWRTMAEIAHWSRYDDVQRVAVLDELRQRQTAAGVNRRRETKRRQA